MHLSTIKKIPQNLPTQRANFWFRFFAQIKIIFGVYWNKTKLIQMLLISSFIEPWLNFIPKKFQLNGVMVYLPPVHFERHVFMLKGVAALKPKGNLYFLSSPHTQSNKHILWTHVQHVPYNILLVYIYIFLHILEGNSKWCS